MCVCVCVCVWRGGVRCACLEDRLLFSVCVYVREEGVKCVCVCVCVCVEGRCEVCMFGR